VPYKDPEKQREADRRWREANPEKSREQSRRWREANLEKARAREAAYRAANREARRTYMADYRASQKEAGRLHALEATFAVQTPEGPGARFSRSCPRAGDPSPHRAPMNGHRGSGMRTEDAYPNPHLHTSVNSQLSTQRAISITPSAPSGSSRGRSHSCPARH
jgi:hypothetical protein